MIKQSLLFITLFFCILFTASGQENPIDKNGLALDTIVHFTKADVDPLFGLTLKNREGWIFKSGNEKDSSPINIDLAGWERLSPSQITNDMADSSGKFEGWFRLRFAIDSAIAKLPLYLDKEDHSAEDIYLNGKLFRQFGEKGKDRDSFKEHIQDFEIRTPIFLEPDTVHTLAIHYVDYSTYGNIFKVAPVGSTRIVSNAYFEYMSLLSFKALFDLISSFIFSILFWLLYILIRKEKELFIIALFCTVMLLNTIASAFYGGDSLFFTLPSNIMIPLNYVRNILFIAFPVLCLLFGYRMLYGKLQKWLILFCLIAPLIMYFSFQFSLITIIGIAIFLLIFALKSRKKKMSVRVVMFSLFLSFTITFLGLMLRWFSSGDHLSLRLISVNSDLIGKGILYLGMLAFVAYRMREKNEDMRQNAMELVKVEAEKSALITSQNEKLELKVKERTSALNQSLEELKATQSQLIQSEKMASLGELTAGIAHEIQNPLNFVNNFSEVSNELVDEMNEELDKGDLEEVKAISLDIKQNLEKINHHGKRADNIVKGMLQHSRSNSGTKEPTDINALADEYLRLAYHGLRAKDKSFNAELSTNFDESIGKVNIVPQDMGRVILNLITNAFYAVNEKKQRDVSFKPIVTVSSKKSDEHITISVSDNGNGIPEKVKEKIFQPFFTTKPTGQGTGLGLSMSYDIITKGHSGELLVTTQQGEGTTFKIIFPLI
ncbi:His Kinase A (phospho-acceptor) domain-containing protein [Maribacter dokdonensis]|uniref:ATP-binding protein n=1 Tax=Maribacter dokdonensis TaxID=320912 RepID=UPI001B0A5E53|nr:ATP-binding protein [Maribacter dokdonensis]CAG2532882.1 His Kinase A (phospho-acceptor) domain-containing protein [Maribacter dokdonensis]